MPGDDLLRPDAPSTTRAITIDAPPEEIFPWLLQIIIYPNSGHGGVFQFHDRFAPVAVEFLGR
jgi:hypothetical protein